MSFQLPNFTLEQVRGLFGQYTAEVGQAFAPEVIEAVHKQTAGTAVPRQPPCPDFDGGVGRAKNGDADPLTLRRCPHKRLLREGNTNIDHLRTNVRRDRRFESILLQIASYESGVPFNPDDPLMNELVNVWRYRRGA